HEVPDVVGTDDVVPPVGFGSCGGAGRRVSRPRISRSATGVRMRLAKFGWIGVAVVAATALSIGAAPADAATQYPVPYLFSANVVAAALAPGTPPPGANNWSCRPTAAHPRP